MSTTNSKIEIYVPLPHIYIVERNFNTASRKWVLYGWPMAHSSMSHSLAPSGPSKILSLSLFSFPLFSFLLYFLNSKMFASSIVPSRIQLLHSTILPGRFSSLDSALFIVNLAWTPPPLLYLLSSLPSSPPSNITRVLAAHSPLLSRRPINRASRCPLLRRPPSNRLLFDHLPNAVRFHFNLHF